MIKPSDFTHLHVHTEYSVLDGINRVNTLPEYIKSLGQTACAITDHGNVSGSYRFWKECKKAGIKPIIGMEAYYTVGDRTARERDDLNSPYYHMVLLAQNDVGLSNLYKLSSKAYVEGMYFKPRIDDELLGELNEGIIATSACLGSRSSQLILKGRKQEAMKLLDHHAAIFQDRFFIEIQLHADEEQQTVNKVLMEIAKLRDWPILLTNDCHYTHSDDKLIHEQALCMQTNDVMSNEKRFSFGPIDVHVAHHNWMWDNAQKQNLPYDVIKNTSHVADMIESDKYFRNIRNRYPKFKGLPEGMTSWDALERLCKKGLIENRFAGSTPPAVYRKRIDHELRIIKKMGFSDYMLIDWELVNGARSVGVTVGPGRGSAAGSLVAYSLGITQVDPIKHGLVFERFLNYGRAATPITLTDEMRKEHNHEHCAGCNHGPSEGTSKGGHHCEESSGSSDEQLRGEQAGGGSTPEENAGELRSIIDEYRGKSF